MKKRLLFFVFLLIFAGLGFNLYRSVTKGLWDGRNRFNLVLIGEQIAVFSLAPGEEAVSFLLIPGTTLVETIRGYGTYRINSVFNLGELDNGGGKLISGTIQDYLGLTIDGYARLEDGNIEFVQQALVGLLRNKGETNLTSWDLVRLWWQLKKIRPDRIKMVNLGETSACSEVVLADESSAIEIDSERVDRVVSQLFKDQKVRIEDLAVAVLNRTSHQGLAGRAARLITNIGGRVVEVGEAESLSVTKPGEKCEVQSAEKLRNSYTVKKLIRIFDCSWGGEALGGHRAEVILILNEDYWQRLNRK